MFLRKLTLQNFKGIKSFTIDFTNKETFIYGDNGTGKTTLFDAYTWVLSGKDSNGLSDSGVGKFELRPLNENGEPEHNLEHMVEGLFEHDGRVHKISRVLTEDWVKDGKTKELTLKGLETKRFWNDAPIKAKDFETRLAELFTDFDIFKLLSDPFAFSKLHWTKRKQIISDICGITENDNDILNGVEGCLFLKSHLKSKKFSDTVAMIKYGKSETQKKLDQIPVRINQEKESMSDMPDVEALTKRKIELQGLLTSIDSEHTKFLNSQREATKARQTKLNDLYSQMSKIINAEAAVIQKKDDDEIRFYEGVKSALYRVRNECAALLNEVETIKGAIKVGDDKLASLRDDFKAIQKEVLPENSTICPTCLQEYPKNKLVEIKANFSVNQKVRLDKINAEGKAIATKVAAMKEKLQSKEDELATCTEILKGKEEEFKAIPEPNIGAMPSGNKLYEMAEIKASSNLEFRAIEKEYIELSTSVLEFEDHTEDANTKNAYLSEILSIEKQLSVRDDIDKRNENISKLNDEEKELSTKLLELQQLQDEVDEYVRFKTDIINSRVSEIFKVVRFKFFDYQFNGGFNDQMCEIMCNGVDWVNLNSASQVNAGMEIIKAMQDRYGVVVPIWIDNRESVINLFETNAQVINLLVSHDKKLTIKDF